jgi:hypothetical protein
LNSIIIFQLNFRGLASFVCKSMKIMYISVAAVQKLCFLKKDITGKVNHDIVITGPKECESLTTTPTESSGILSVGHMQWPDVANTNIMLVFLCFNGRLLPLHTGRKLRKVSLSVFCVLFNIILCNKIYFFIGLYSILILTLFFTPNQ